MLDGVLKLVKGYYDVYVEVPENVGVGTNEANQPITADLKRGDLVRVQGDTNERDEKNETDKRPLVVSQPLVDFLKFFWDNYNKGIKEFNIMGDSGVGKSCAAKILAAEISRKRPDITLFYLRSGVNNPYEDLYQSLAAKRPTVAIIDQIQNEDIFSKLGYFADKPGLTMVLISSENSKHFRTDLHGSQHRKETYEFPFSNSGEDCAGAFGLLVPAFKPADPPFFDLLEKDDPKTFSEQCEWTNGHLETLSLLLVQKKTPKELVNDTAKSMRKYFEQPNKDHLALYLAVVQMFKHKMNAVHLNGARADNRYMTSSGVILSPYFLQAYETCLLNLPPPHNFMFSTYHLEPEKEFAAKREILQDHNIAKIVSLCLQALGNKIPSLSVPFSRIRYDKFSQLAKEVASHLAADGESKPEKFADSDSSSSPPPTDKNSWAVHGIPVIWNKHTDIDGLHAYCLNGSLFIIGYSISFETAQEHAKSLSWFEGLSAMRTELGVNGANAQFVLLFISKPTESGELVAAAPIPEGCTVMDYPITRVASQAVISHYFKLKEGDGEGEKTYGPRVLDVVVKGKKRKSPDKHYCCSCRTGNCMKCVCGKHNTVCANCVSDFCANKA